MRPCLSPLIALAFAFALASPTPLRAAVGAATSATLAVPSARLIVGDRTITVTQHDRPTIALTDLKFDYASPLSWTITEADAQHITVALTYPSEVDYYHRSNDTTPRTTELLISTRDDGFRLQASPAWANQTTLEFNHTGDHVFGLSSPLQPDNRHSPEMSGAAINVEVASEGETLAENYASVFSAFYLSSHGYGAFFDTFGAGRYTFAVNGHNQIHHETGRLDWYLFFGPDGAAIHRAYYHVIGGPKHVPLWALGPIAWRDQNNGGAAEILADARHFADLRLPLTGWFVDRPYSEGAHAWSHMNFAPNFADPGTWIRTLHDELGLEFMTWTSTAFFGDTPLKRHLAGDMTYADLSDPTTVQGFEHKLATLQHQFGVKGHKMDRADEHFPPWVPWADPAVRVGERRNRYVYLFAQVHDEALRRAWGDDQFTFARAAIHRTQPYLSALWGGDPRTNWAGLQGNAANAMRAALMGFPMWGTDIGGYLGEGYIDPDLYLRWLEFGSLCGLMEIKLDGSGGEGRDRLPWHYDEAFQAQFRAILARRMSLLPYLNSLANTSAVRGPMMQPLVYRHLDDIRTHDIWDEFYLGDGLLVAPILTAGTTREVYLPAGRWHRFSFDHGIEATLAGGQTVVAQAALSETPLYVRANSLLVTGDLHVGNTRVWTEPDAAPTLTIHAFPGAPGEQATFAYVNAIEGNRIVTLTLQTDRDDIAVRALPLGAATTVIVHRAAGDATASFGPHTPIDYHVAP